MFSFDTHVKISTQKGLLIIVKRIYYFVDFKKLLTSAVFLTIILNFPLFVAAPVF